MGYVLPGTLLAAVDGKQENLEGHKGWRHVVVWVFGHGPQWLLWREREFGVILGIGLETAAQ